MVNDTLGNTSFSFSLFNLMDTVNILFNYRFQVSPTDNTKRTNII